MSGKWKWASVIECITIDNRVYYLWHNMMVRSYQQSKYLSVPKEDASIAEIGDIGAVAEDDLPEDFVRVEGVTVGVLSLQSYLSCLQCKCKVDVGDEALESAPSAICNNALISANKS